MFPTLISFLLGFWCLLLLIFCLSTHTLKCLILMSVVNLGSTACKHFEPGRAKYTSRVIAQKRPQRLVAPEKGSYSLRTVQREAFCCVFARMWGSKFCLLKERNGPFLCLCVHGPWLCHGEVVPSGWRCPVSRTAGLLLMSGPRLCSCGHILV